MFGKLWMVIYVGSHVGGSVGPLPYDMAECERRSLEMNAKIDREKDKPEVIAKMQAAGIPADKRNLKFVCEEHITRPAITLD